MKNSNADSKQKKENNNKGADKTKKDTPKNSMIVEEDGIRAIGGA